MDPFSVDNESIAPGEDPVAPTAEQAGSQTAPDQATEAPAADDPGVEQAEAPKPKPVQKRIGELVREREAARREAEYWRQQAAMMQPAPASQAAAPPAELKAEDFPTYEDYLVAKAEKKASATLQTELARRAEDAQRMAEQRQQDAILSEFATRAETARERYEDFDLVVSDPATPITAHMAQAIVLSAAGHDVAYYLGRNKNEAARISALSPLAQAMEIGRLEARIAAQPRRVTQTPAPPATVGGRGVPARNPESAQSYDEFVKLRRKQQGFG
jgi:hypothetical protein